MRLPRGRLVRSRVIADVGTALAGALDRRLTGYAALAPEEALLFERDATGVLTFEDGIPVLAYHSETGRGGPPALADLAVPGPYRLDLYELPAGALEPIHDTPELAVPPGMPAERLAGDPDLAGHTREHAPADRVADGDPEEGGLDAVEAFLDDEEKIAAIRERARREAERRAEEWGF